MKRILIIQTLICLLLSGCAEKVGQDTDKPSVASLMFDYESLVVGRDEQASIDVTLVMSDKSLHPYNVSKDSLNLNLEWLSSDPEIVSVDAAGVLTGIKTGKAVVSLSSSVNPKLYAQIDIEVKLLDVQSLRFTKQESECDLYSSLQLVLQAQDRQGQYYVYDIAADASRLNFEWSCNEPSVLSVDASGLVTPHAVGTATVSISSKAISGLSASVKITISEQSAYGISFGCDTLYLSDYASYPLEVYTVGGDKTLTKYNIADDPLSLGLKFTVESNSLLNIANNSITTLPMADGSVTLSVASSDGAYVASVVVRVTVDDSSKSGVSGRLYSSLIYSNNGELPIYQIMQGFDIDSKGDIYCAIVSKEQYRAYISRGRPNAKYNDYMTLQYFGHCSNHTIEEVGDDRYVWVENLGSKDNEGYYYSCQLISRFKYEPGTTLNSWQTPENYYFGYTGASVAVDVKNDILAVTASSNIGTSVMLKAYRLSELRALPVTQLTMAPVRIGGEDGNKEYPSAVYKSFTMSVKDASRVKPLSQCVFYRESTVPWQGFDVCDGKYYLSEGAGTHDNVRTSYSYVTIIALDGRIVERRTEVACISDLEQLTKYNISPVGCAEAEGVKVRDGKLYLGYGVLNSLWNGYATILQFTASSKPTPIP